MLMMDFWTRPLCIPVSDICFRWIPKKEDVPFDISSSLVVDRGIEPLCQDWESCILTIRWIHQLDIWIVVRTSAEAGGFEPPVRLPARQFSKLLVSATHPNFLSGCRSTISKCECKGKAFISFLQIFFEIFFRKRKTFILLPIASPDIFFQTRLHESSYLLIGREVEVTGDGVFQSGCG